MKILLTGGNGFIGKNVIEKLGGRYEIIAPGSFELNLLDEDSVMKYISQNRPDVIVHAASVGLKLGQDGEQDILEKNLRMYLNLLRGEAFYQKIIVLGSGAEYDKTQDIKQIAEDDKNSKIPTEQYAFSKYIMSQLALNNQKNIHLRLFGIFGPHEDYTRRFISNAICMALLELPITIKQNVYFDYLFVGDFIDILEKFIQKDSFKHRIYNVGRGERLDLVTIAKMVLKVTSKNLPINVLNSGLNKEYTCNVDRLKNEFSDIAFTDMEAAIGQLVAHYRLELPSIDKNIFLNRA